MESSAVTLPRLSTRTVAAGAAGVLVLLLNFYLFTRTDWTMLRGGSGADWTIFGEAGRRALNGGALYASEDNYAFRYSPLLAYLFAVITPIGPLAWRLLHLAAVGALGFADRRLALITLIAWPFWFDLEAGNLTTFVYVIAVFALSGRRWAIGAYLLASLLVPRPLMLPIAVLLLWRHSEWRLPFVAIFALHAVVVLATGWAPAWIGALATSSTEMGSLLNFGPSRIIGWVWVPIGLFLATVLTIRGRLGLAALAASPYWLPYYFLFPLLELRHQPTSGATRSK
jgi:hypothetical protein